MSTFLDRFDTAWGRKRQVQLGQTLAGSLLVAVLGFGLLAVADYFLELDRIVRVIGLVLTGIGAAASVSISSWRASQRGDRAVTAAEVESVYPELGQCVRTSVQFARMTPRQIHDEGVEQSLLAALDKDLDERAEPLGLGVVIPSGRLAMVAVGLAALIGVLGLAIGHSWQWRTASWRAALAERPYRSLEVMPGDLLVDEGLAAEIQVTLVGRANRDVVLWTRAAALDGDAASPWTERVLSSGRTRGTNSDEGAAAPDAAGPAASVHPPQARFVARLERLARPVEYKVVAGDLSSGLFRVDIRRPPRIAEFRCDVTPPTYTAQPVATSADPNLSALEGSSARFRITFDKPMRTASLVFAPRKRASDEDPPTEPEVLPLALSSHHASRDEARSPAARVAPNASAPERALAPAPSNSIGQIDLVLTEDRKYRIVAEATDGTQLEPNKFSIRVRRDQPPDIAWESPQESIEVHALAELLLQIRAWDDYGLTKAGIVFQINNEQSITLVDQDFTTVADAARELEDAGAMRPTTRAAVEKILPLELFEMTQKDSVMYYAFAEDNRPDAPQRVETELRFIDIRPFKRVYQVIDPDPMPEQPRGGAALKSLEELIQRQRFAVNRTTQIEKRAAVGRMPDAPSLDQLMEFEKDLATSARETAQGLEARGFDDTELFYQAEAAMLQAVDSLSVGKWENATLQMRDALKFLIEQRDRTAEVINKNPDRARLSEVRAFDRKQAQKIRRPKSDKEEARELVRRLEELIAREESVAGEIETPAPAANE